MSLFIVSSNIAIVEDKLFGDYHKPQIIEILRSVDIFFTSHIGQEPFSSKQVIVVHKEGLPVCCNTAGPLHIIYLSTHDDYWSQWVYQFSHEYCHHLIDGPLDGNISGLKWFEEVLARIAAFAALLNLSVVCSKSEEPSLQRFTLLNFQYLLSHLLPHLQPGKETSTPRTLSLNQFLEPFPESALMSIRDQIDNWQRTLDSVYDDSKYQWIAAHLYPHFHNNRNLWKILPHIGDSCSWKSLQDLYGHLRPLSDDSYRDSLDSLFACLLD